MLLRGIPLDGIGVQCHITGHVNPTLLQVSIGEARSWEICSLKTVVQKSSFGLKINLKLFFLISVFNYRQTEKRIVTDTAKTTTTITKTGFQKLSSPF